MNCPNCGEVLVMSERQGVEIDYCPKCRGVWLDRGELDKIIDKSSNEYSSNSPFERQSDSGFDKHDSEYHEKHDPYKNNPNYRRKKKGFLGDLFDFD